MPYRKILSSNSGRVCNNSQCFETLANKLIVISCGYWDNSFKVLTFDGRRLLQSINQHRGTVTCAAVGLDGRTLVTGSRDTTLMIWTLNPGSGSALPVTVPPRLTLFGHYDEVSAVAVNCELDVVVSGGNDGSVLLHTLRTGTFVWSTNPVGDRVTSINISGFIFVPGLTSVTIPGSVSVIDDTAFLSCSDLEIVSYLGNSDPGVNAKDMFYDCHKLRAICVPLLYNSTNFCGETNFCKKESCDKMHDIENACLFATCNNSQWIVRKTENATKWENQTDQCFEYQCSIDSGYIRWSMCNSTANVTRTCVNGKCLDDVSYSHRIMVNIVSMIMMFIITIFIQA